MQTFYSVFNHFLSLSLSFQCYKRILQLDPVNIQGLHNLCVVYVERGRLAKAQECLQHAHHLAPGEDYILRHLQIVQTRLGKLRQSADWSKEKEIAFAEYDPTDFGGSSSGSVLVNEDGAASSNAMVGGGDVAAGDGGDDTDVAAAVVSAGGGIGGVGGVGGGGGGGNGGVGGAATKTDDDASMKNTIPAPIVLDVADGKKETRKSVSKQEKPSAAAGATIVMGGSSSKPTNEPIFIEAETSTTTTTATIQQEYRPSNSGQNGVNRRLYHQHHHHPPHTQQGLVGSSDRDDPSSGMS